MLLLAQALLWISLRSRERQTFAEVRKARSRPSPTRLTHPPVAPQDLPARSPRSLCPGIPTTSCSSSGVHVAHSGTSFKSFKSECHPLPVVSPGPPCKGNPSVLPDSILLLFPTQNVRNGPNVLCSNLQCDGLGRRGLGQTMGSRGWGPALEICALVTGTRVGSQASLPVSQGEVGSPPLERGGPGQNWDMLGLPAPRPGRNQASPFRSHPVWGLLLQRLN